MPEISIHGAKPVMLCSLEQGALQMHSKPSLSKNKTPEVIHYGLVPSDAGLMLIAASSSGVVALAFLGEQNESQALADLRLNLRDVSFVRDDRAVAKYAEAAGRFLAKGDAARNAISLDLRGTDFQKRVWEELMRLPSGAKATYSDIAQRIGMPRAVRAVATAIGDNPVSLFVPCHRVLRRDGSLGGYRWGLNVKQRLMNLEAPATSAPPRRHAQIGVAA